MKHRAWLWVLATATFLSLPVLWLGFFNDDFIHRIALSGVSETYWRGALTLYDFLRGASENADLMDTGLLPWFADPELTARFFRPLSSLTLALDVVLFGERALPAHLHSLAWFAAAVVLVWKIHRALLPARAAAWATFVFAVAGAHVETTSWIAARHILVSGTFGLLAWYVEIRRQELGRPRLSFLAAAALVVGLLSSEAALCAVPFIVAQAWFGASGSTRQRATRALPALAVVLAYLAAYTLGGYGTRNIGSYASPFDSPGRFVVAVFEKLPLLANELFTAIPCVLSYAGESAARAFFALGVVASALIVAFAVRDARTLGEDARHVSWLPLATAASLVPVCGTIIDGRVLLLPMVGSSALVGLLLSRIAPQLPSSRARRALRVAGLGALFFLHLGLAPVVRVGFALNYLGLGKLQAALPSRAKLACDPKARLIVANGSDPTVGMYGAALFYRAEGLERPGFHVLSMAQNDLELERLGERTLVLRTVGERRGHFIEEFFRPRHHALRAGDVVRLYPMTATVLDTAESGPTHVRFTFDADPNEPANCLAAWVGGAEGRLESLSLPADGALRIRYEPGPMGL